MQILRQVLSRTAFSSRGEQRGATHINLPVRSVGILLACGVGAAWALSPGGELRELSLDRQLERQMVVEGEPQSVAVLVQSLFGPDAITESQKRLLSGAGSPDTRWVLSAPIEGGSEREVQGWSREAAFCRAVEEIEEECSLRGAYPQIPPSEDAFLTGLVYRHSQDRVELACDDLVYSSESGLRRADTSEGLEVEGSPGGPALELQGSLEPVEQGWGPWAKRELKWTPRPSASESEPGQWTWLEELAPVGRESARLFFPVSRESTGYLFRNGRGETPYRDGELMYDRLSGSFLLKLHRVEESLYQERSGNASASLLAERTENCILVGDSALIESLGFGRVGEEELAAVASDVVFQGSPLDALTAARLSSFRPLEKSADEVAENFDSESAGSALVVGRFHFVDHLGQVHRVDLRAGQAMGYDWVLGQFTAVEEVPVWTGFQESTAYSPENGTDISSVIAGE